MIAAGAGSAVLALILASVPAPSASAEDVWTRDAENPVLTESGDADRFDSTYIGSPRVVYDDETDTYFMYYTGAVRPNIARKEMVGLATAPSLHGPWTRYDAKGDRRSLFPPGEPGEYDRNRNWGEGTVLKERKGVWKMWTVGDGGEGSKHVGRVGYASSTNGYDWTKYAGEKPGGAVFEDFHGVTSGARGILEFAVLKEGDTYHAWYALFRPRNTIKYATSPDGIHWTARRVVLKDVYGISNVVKIGETYYLTTSKPDLSAGLFFTSKDKVHWTRCDDLRLSPSKTGWDAGQIYYPFLLPASKHEWHIFYTAVGGNRGSRIGHAVTVRP